ncbi:MAG TPA: hypothetical protein VN376_08500, partial [Longilinea sp.]|nr:hypothetical protein [Longilinea sp.]
WVSDRTGFSADLVPGYYQLQPEEAQFISMVDSLIASGSVPTELAQSWLTQLEAARIPGDLSE